MAKDVKDTIRPKFRIVKPAREHFKKFFDYVVKLFEQNGQNLPDDFTDELNKLWQSIEFKKKDKPIIMLDDKTSYELITYTPTLPRSQYQALQEWYNQNKSRLAMKSFYQFLLAISLYFIANKSKYRELFVVKVNTLASENRDYQSKLKNFRVRPSKSSKSKKSKKHSEDISERKNASEPKVMTQISEATKTIEQQKPAKLKESEETEVVESVEHQTETNYEELADISPELKKDTYDGFVDTQLLPMKGGITEYRRNREKHMLEMIYRIYEELDELKTYLRDLEEELRSLQAKYSNLKSDYELSISDIKSALKSIFALTND